MHGRALAVSLALGVAVLAAACGDAGGGGAHAGVSGPTGGDAGGDHDAPPDAVTGDSEPVADLDDAGDGDPVGDADAPPTCGGWCAGYREVDPLGRVQEAALQEISGVASSRQNTGVLYVHNDSGHAPEVFALSLAGETLGVFELSGATNRDWEDLALGPCPDGTCVYVGDIGDANASDGVFTVYRFREPQVAQDDPLGTVQVAWEALRYEYPGGGKRNAETLLVHPSTGDVYVVTKTGLGKKSAVYKFPTPLVAGSLATLTKVADLAVPEDFSLPITGGAIHPCGDGLLLRAYDTLYLFKLAPGAAFDTLFTASFVTVPVAVETQGEAVAWRADGLGYLTISEGSSQDIHATSCE